MGPRESTPMAHGSGPNAHSFDVYNPGRTSQGSKGGWSGSVDDVIFLDHSSHVYHHQGGGQGTVRRKAKRERNKTTDAVQIVYPGSMGR